MIRETDNSDALRRDHDAPRGAANLTVALVSIGMLTVIGWIIGVYRLWTRPPWSQRERLVGTLVPLAGVVLVVICAPLWTADEVCRNAAGNGQLTCSGGPTKLGDSVFLTAVWGPPIFTAAYLARGLMRRRGI